VTWPKVGGAGITEGTATGDGRSRRCRTDMAVEGAVAEQGTRDERSRSGELSPSWPARRGAGEPLRLPTRWGTRAAA
jgi:hypothetical protein